MEDEAEKYACIENKMALPGALRVYACTHLTLPMISKQAKSA